MKKKILSFFLGLLIFATSFTGVAVAKTKEGKLTEVKNDIKNIKNNINNKKGEVKKIDNRMLELDRSIDQAENQISNLQGEISQTQGDINKAQGEINELAKKIKYNEKLLGKRINIMYKTSDIGYLEVLLSSKDVTELLSNMDMIKKIVAYDKNILATLRISKNQFEAKKTKLESNKTRLTSLKATMEQQQIRLQADISEQNKIKSAIQSDIKQLEAQEDALFAQAKALEKEIRALTAKTSNAPYKGGVMGWPLSIGGRITSPFGNRIHPVLKTAKMHTGVDIAAPSGTSVLAAGDGTVIFAGWKGSYGKMVMIDHGGGIVTVYAHNSSILVSSGQSVKKGEVISKVGSTGRSTGPHLHFEVRKNGAYVNPMGYIQ